MIREGEEELLRGKEEERYDLFRERERESRFTTGLDG